MSVGVAVVINAVAMVDVVGVVAGGGAVADVVVDVVGDDA